MKPNPLRIRLGWLALALLAACAPGREPEQPRPSPPALPPIPAVDGPLEIVVRYPDPDTYIPSDSNFIFGSIGTGRGTLTVNGRSVDVAPNGAFLGFLPVPADGVYVLRAEACGRAAAETVRVQVPAGREPGPASAAAIAESSIRPRGALVLREGEELTVRFRGSPGGQARLILPDSTSVPLREMAAGGGLASGFMQETDPRERATEYVARFPLRQPITAGDTAVAMPTLAGPGPEAGPATLELVIGGDTVRGRLPANVALLRPAETPVVGVAEAEETEGDAIGVAALPPGTPYHYFFPRGTRLPITGEAAGHYRVQLDEDLSIWVRASQVRLAGAGDVSGAVGNIRVTPAGLYDEVRIDTSERFPFHVSATERELVVHIFGARSRTNWIYVPTRGQPIERVDWEQVSDREYRVRIGLAEPLWGWRSGWDAAGNLVIGVRRPPALDAANPFAGVAIAVDAGHPPGGAIGPTGLTEAEANLDIVSRLVPMLRARGARVIVTRPDTAAVGLYERVLQAEAEGADVFVSVHNNAFGAGVNPFERAGTSVLYNRPQSVDLARALQDDLLDEFGLRDLGIIHADRAVVRATFFPSALTETMFLMIPRQEAALRNPEVHDRIALAHVRALEEFLRQRARTQDR